MPTPRLSLPLLAGLAAASAAPSFASDGWSPRRLAPDAALADVHLLRETLERVHPGLDRYTSAEAIGWLLDDLERDAAAGTTDLALYADVSRVLAHIRCGHTKAELPEAIEAHRRETPSYLPFAFEFVGGRMLVDRVDDAQAGLAPGDEIVAIDGRAVGDIVADVEPFLSVDGWTDHAKRCELAFSSELLGDAIDVFWPALYGWPADYRLTVREATGALREVAMAPVTYDRWLAIATDGDERYSNFDTSVEFRMLDPKTAYLAVNTFVNYRTEADPFAVFGPHFAAMREAGAEHLVLDLRRCGGGSTDVPVALLALLADRPVTPAKRQPWVRSIRFDGIREHLSTWDESVFDLPAELFTRLDNGYYEVGEEISPRSTIEPRDDRFTGRLTVLTSAHNASGATNLVAVLREHRESMRTVGEPTGGTAEGTTAGLLFLLTLPESGIRVRVPVMRSFNDVARFEPGRGVEPDVVVRRTIEDVRLGRDVVLEAARR